MICTPTGNHRGAADGRGGGGQVREGRRADPREEPDIRGRRAVDRDGAGRERLAVVVRDGRHGTIGIRTTSTSRKSSAKRAWMRLRSPWRRSQSRWRMVAERALTANGLGRPARRNLPAGPGSRIPRPACRRGRWVEHLEVGRDELPEVDGRRAVVDHGAGAPERGHGRLEDRAHLAVDRRCRIVEPERHAVGAERVAPRGRQVDPPRARVFREAPTITSRPRSRSSALRPSGPKTPRSVSPSAPGGGGMCPRPGTMPHVVLWRRHRTAGGRADRAADVAADVPAGEPGGDCGGRAARRAAGARATSHGLLVVPKIGL